MPQHKHYSSHDAGPEWATPEYIWRPLAEALGTAKMSTGVLGIGSYPVFDLDPASGCEEKPIATTCYQLPETDGLTEDWFGHVWVNPPYGREFNDPWAEKIERERVAAPRLTP